MFVFVFENFQRIWDWWGEGWAGGLQRGVRWEKDEGADDDKHVDDDKDGDDDDDGDDD